MSGGVLPHVRSHLLRGLLLVLPLLVTLWLLGILFRLILVHVTPLVLALLGLLGVPGGSLWSARWVTALVGLVLTVVVVYLLGLLAGNIVGRRIVAALEAGILKVPFVKGIYGAARQLLDAFGSSGKRAFSQVVLVEYPRDGLWTLGFVTWEGEHVLDRGVRGSQRLIRVFLPATPNPTSGRLVLVDRDLVVPVDLGIEEALKLVVSGGIVGPPDLAKRFRPNLAAARAPSA